ncbi:hypothetical protein KK083_11110 [Fulvivirgaceae bacterium PWU4]|uniref:Uncharacterized protein n=1 Tax=Chryseosolibacter histidini TaxID=2782349 RepID=A0AAP2DJC4_9BACT|nr:hypothetical protein [Chryseosolibacter histidini]MBT1697428.1 hypothetical protein [Chryseosolibacter histidini]
MDKIVVEIVTSADEILKSLMESHDSGTMIGITSPELGPDTYITAVRDILIDDDDPIIVIRGYDRSGYFFSKDTLSLKSITSVIPFNSIFDNPFLREVKKELEVIRGNRENNASIKTEDYIS